MIFDEKMTLVQVYLDLVNVFVADLLPLYHVFLALVSNLTKMTAYGHDSDLEPWISDLWKTDVKKEKKSFRVSFSDGR